MEIEAIHARLREHFPDATGELQSARDPWAPVQAAALPEVARFLREDPQLRFDCLSNASVVDRLERGVFELVYHLYSYPWRHSLVLKAEVPREDPVAPTLEGVWKIANWLEREMFDLMGVRFSGHSDLRRLLMPEDWPGHPARKDFVEPEEYHGIRTSRESLLR